MSWWRAVDKRTLLPVISLPQEPQSQPFCTAALVCTCFCVSLFKKQKSATAICLRFDKSLFRCLIDLFAPPPLKMRKMKSEKISLYGTRNPGCVSHWTSTTICMNNRAFFVLFFCATDCIWTRAAITSPPWKQRIPGCWAKSSARQLSGQYLLRRIQRVFDLIYMCTLILILNQAKKFPNCHS